MPDTSRNTDTFPGIFCATEVYPVHPANMIRVHAMLHAPCAMLLGRANFFIDDTGASSYVKLHFHGRPPGVFKAIMRFPIRMLFSILADSL
jgi:hypothetical protein